MSERRSPPLYLGFPSRDRILRRFWQFHREHPSVYRYLRSFANEARVRWNGPIGIALLFERVRWYVRFETPAEKARRHETGDFKLNNDFRALYARLLMHRDPNLRDAFFVRLRRGEKTLRDWARRMKRRTA